MALTPYTPFTQGMYQESPLAKLETQAGTNALTNAFSLSGGMNSNNLKGLIDYTTGVTGKDYQTALANYIQQWQLGNTTKQQTYNNLAGLSAGGLSAGLQQGQISQNVGQNIGSNIIGAGNAQAAGTVGVGNALTGGIGSGYNAWLQNQYLNRLGTQPGAPVEDAVTVPL